jgi:hypothetical protein
MKLELDVWYEMWNRVGSHGLDTWFELSDSVEDGGGGRGSNKAANGDSDGTAGAAESKNRNV